MRRCFPFAIGFQSAGILSRHMSTRCMSGLPSVITTNLSSPGAVPMIDGVDPEPAPSRAPPCTPPVSYVARQTLRRLRPFQRYLYCALLVTT